MMQETLIYITTKLCMWSRLQHCFTEKSNSFFFIFKLMPDPIVARKHSKSWFYTKFEVWYEITKKLTNLTNQWVFFFKLMKGSVGHLMFCNATFLLNGYLSQSLKTSLGFIISIDEFNSSTKYYHLLDSL